MEPTREEKTERLKVMLEDALQPLFQKIDKLEVEIASLKENQEEIKRTIQK